MNRRFIRYMIIAIAVITILKITGIVQLNTTTAIALIMGFVVYDQIIYWYRKARKKGASK